MFIPQGDLQSQRIGSKVRILSIELDVSISSTAGAFVPARVLVGKWKGGYNATQPFLISDGSAIVRPNPDVFVQKKSNYKMLGPLGGSDQSVMHFRYYKRFPGAGKEVAYNGTSSTDLPVDDLHFWAQALTATANVRLSYGLMVFYKDA